MRYAKTGRTAADKRWLHHTNKMAYWKMRLSACWAADRQEYEDIIEAAQQYKLVFYKES